MLLRKFAIVLLLLLCVGSAAAQGTVIPAQIGENVTGEVSPATPVSVFSLQVDAPQTLEIQVLTIGSGLTPAFRVIDPSGLVLQSVDNSAGSLTVEGTVTIAAPGLYRIEISGTFNTFGSFLMSIQPGEALAAPEPLSVGASLISSVSSDQTRQAFTVAGSPNDFMLLTTEALSRDASPVFVLRDFNTGELLGSAGALLGGARFRLPPGTGQYVLEVLFSGEYADFFVCFEGEVGATGCGSTGASASSVVPTALPLITATPFVATQAVLLPTINPSGACTAATAAGSPINVRSGPGTNFSVITQLSPSATASVIGRLPDNTWYQVTVSGLTGWVSGTVVRLGGNCGAVPAVTLPTNTNPNPTAAVTATVTPTLMFTAAPTLTPQPPAATLSISSPPNYGSTALTSGFVPDPFQVGITAGGGVNVGYLGSACRGFATSAPDFSVNYTAGAFPTLRFYFVGAGDSTMVINSPNGSFFCNDDSFGTLNPTIDFNSPGSGRYDIWIGSFASGTFISGTLFVTESTGNRP